METDLINKKQKYLKELIDKKYVNNNDKAISNMTKYVPLFNFEDINIHEEDITNVNKDINRNILLISKDIELLSSELTICGEKYKSLLKSSKDDLDSIKKDIKEEKERLKDLNILCNKYKMKNIKRIKDCSISGNFSKVNDDIFCSEIINIKKVALDVPNVQGNGYEGNKYVLNDKNKFISEKMPTDDRKYITDNNNYTVYEYSRITSDANEKEIFPLLNKDKDEAKCTIYLEARIPINTIKVVCSSIDTTLTEINVSNDGINYTTVLKYDVEISNSNIKYSNLNYICESGLFCFPESKYIKITLQSKAFTGDKIGFYKINIDDERKK